ncbi:transporter substrate-binding domain-containing protein [Psychrobium sp. MM17-31]|uniref:substrate-binding periplasmic protein n=1 Tax=Psychrobium sp. MM17-31 TaxID=2917758 RepID=UPI001EF508B0|nr:transporter substrate-binding domain-containing protein [Psychrobium sp. MM17-31]MCG7532539.1 transporter substrate-binding domain-containing protein [Psychrobium sp. MM17-31]
MKWLICLILCFYSGYLTAQNPSAEPPLLVVTEDLWPFNYLEDNQIKGSATTLVKQLLEQADMDYTLALLPWARSYQMARTKPNVMIYTINHTASRHDKFHWITHIPVKVESNFYALADHKLAPQTKESIKQLRIAALIDSVNDAFLVRNKFEKVSRVSRITQSVGMLKRGRVDLVISSENAILHAIRQNGLARQDIVKIDTAFSSKPAIAMSIQTPQAIVTKLQQTAQALHKSQGLCKIMEIAPADCIKVEKL